MRSPRTTGLSLLGLTLAAVDVAPITLGEAEATPRALHTYPRESTLYTTGTQWGEARGFNPFTDLAATGTVGLAYETLFRYDPVEHASIPWLAANGYWTGPRSYELEIRTGIAWSDGDPFTPTDVAWNLELGRFDTATWHTLYEQLQPNGITVVGDTVHLAFATTPSYVEWKTLLWNLPMVKPTQWAAVDSQTLLAFDPNPPVGTGPYVLDPAGYEVSTQVAWRKSPTTWWAAAAGLEPDPKPLYIVDRVGGGDDFSDLIYGRIDSSNVFIRDLPAYLGAGLGLHTYGSSAPSYLPANTVWLVTNTHVPPLADPRFRRALAYAIDVDRIVADDYSGAVVKANPTGLPPTLSRYVNGTVVSQYGFSYDVDVARQLLETAGYVDSDGDGYVENLDGTPIDLGLMVPSDWLDWKIAIVMIANSAKRAGIRITPTPVDFPTWYEGRASGSFDLLLDNSVPLTDTPWTSFDYLFRQPVEAMQTTANFSRFTGPAADQAWYLTQQLDATPPVLSFLSTMLVAQIEQIMLEQLPAIPLWYTGAWAAESELHWTNWPASCGTLQFVPVLWNAYFRMTGIDMIAHLEPA